MSISNSIPPESPITPHSALWDAKRLCDDLIACWNEASEEPIKRLPKKFAQLCADKILSRACEVGRNCETAANEMPLQVPVASPQRASLLRVD